MAEPRKAGYVRDDYAAAVGDDALERQAEELRVRFDCYGELKTDGHHPVCRRREDEPIEIHPDQASLL